MQFELSSSTWGDEELEAIRRVLAGGRTTMGENVKAFERAFSDRFRVRHATMVSSGSMANLVSVGAFFYKKERPLRAGDEVIVPSISWATTFHPLLQYGLKLRFLDVELDTLNMDVSQLEAALTPKTRMVVAVSILGNPCALDRIRAFCDKHSLYLLEDNCESMGARLNGKDCGTFGDIGTFSTFFSHHISTMEGGVIVTENRELSDLVTCLRAHGWTRDLPADTTLFEKRDSDFYEAYRFILPGYNARPLELSGAVGLAQLPKLNSMVEIRRKNAELFVELFKNDDRFIIQRENGRSSWFAFTMILAPECRIEKAKVWERLKNSGIQFRIITGGNFLQHDVIKYYDHTRVGEIRNAFIAHDRGFFVGNHPRDITKEIEWLHKSLKDL